MVLLIRSMDEKFVFLITQLCEPQILQEYGCFEVERPVVFQPVIVHWLSLHLYWSMALQILQYIQKKKKTLALLLPLI